MDIYYEQENDNWYINTTVLKRYEVKYCNQDDFGWDDQSIRIYNSWVNYMVICPDFKQGDGLYIADDGLQMIYSQINIKFAKCDSKKKNNICKSDNEIESFLKDLNVNTLSVQDIIDFTQFE